MVGAKHIEKVLADLGIIPSGGATPSPDESLFELGLIDSLGIMMLVQQLEKDFDIKVPEVDLLPDNFDTINAIASYVNKRRHEAATG